MSFGSEVIRDAWRENVFNDARILAFTQKIHEDDILRDQDSTFDFKKTLHCAKVNFIQWFAQRYRKNDEVGSCQKYVYRVRVEYILQLNYNDSSNFNTIQDFFETLDDVVVENLGSSWADTVNSVISNLSYPNITPIAPINKEACNMGSFEYLAEKTQ